jgi:hypothetical protein
MLSDKAQKAADYIGRQVNKITREANEKRWMKNICTNKRHYIQGNPLPKGLVTYLVCAGPSLDKNIQELKTMGERGVIVCIDANLEHLLENGIVPEYCVSIDASNKIWDMMKGIIKQTKDITLVCNSAANPIVVRKWKGPKFFFNSPHPRFGTKSDEYYSLSRYIVAKKDIKKGSELKFGKNYNVVFPGVLMELPCGGNVTTTAHMFCLTCMRATSIVFVGADFSWEDSSHFYAGSKHGDNTKARTLNEPILSHLNINKKRVNTNISLDSFKRWHEQIALMHPYTCINASEGGILGVDDKGRKEPFFGFGTLKDIIREYSPMSKHKARVRYPKGKQDRGVITEPIGEIVQDPNTVN